MLTITIDPTGAAFEEDAVHEVARLINKAQGKVVSGRVSPGGDPAPLVDFNGNTVGKVEWTA